MKKIKIDTLVKDKLTAHEIGQLMIKDCITGIISGLNDKDIMEGRKPQERLLDTAEINKLIDGLTGTYNIQIYRKYRELWTYLVEISIMQITFAFTIEIALWKLAHAFQCRDKFPIGEKEIKVIKIAIREIVENIKKFFFYEAVKKLIAEFTQVYEILQTMTAFPDDLFRYVNHLIYVYNFLERQAEADIFPPIHKYNVPEEQIQKALLKVKYVSTLYDEESLKELLIPEIVEFCPAGKEAERKVFMENS